MSNKKTKKRQSVEKICDTLGMTYPKSFEKGSTVEKDWVIELMNEINALEQLSITFELSGSETKEELMKMISKEMSFPGNLIICRKVAP